MHGSAFRPPVCVTGVLVGGHVCLGVFATCLLMMGTCRVALTFLRGFALKGMRFGESVYQSGEFGGV